MLYVIYVIVIDMYLTHLILTIILVQQIIVITSVLLLRKCRCGECNVQELWAGVPKFHLLGP